MSLLNLSLNFLLSIPLLWINGLFGKWKLHSYGIFGYSEFGIDEISHKNFSQNFFQMIVHPSIYLALICWVLQLFSFEEVIYHLWLLIPFYWLLRVIHTILHDTFVFTNWQPQLQAFFLSVILGEGTLFFIILPLIKEDESIFIEATAFRDAFWYAILIYICKIIWDLSKNHFIGETVYPSNKKTEVILHRYSQYQKKYDNYIQCILNKKYPFHSANQRKHFLCLLYAIMIYETHNRPFWVRALEYCMKFLLPFRTMSLGIMQVRSRKWISNKSSIFYAIDKVYSVFSTAKISEKLEKSIYAYNPCDNYYEQVILIYTEISQSLNLPPLKSASVKVKRRYFVSSRKTV